MTPTNPRPGDMTGAEQVDVLIVGAGLSGIGAACRLQTDAPGTSYAIVEARGASGGTWDLFRFPGVRSDSDMFTLSYPFRPWTRARAIAGGDEILRYVRETAGRMASTGGSATTPAWCRPTGPARKHAGA